MAKTKNPSVPLVVKLIAVVVLIAVILSLAKTHTSSRTQIQTLKNQLKDARQKLSDTETQAAADKDNLQALTEQLIRQYELQSLQKQAGNANKTTALTQGKLIAILYSPQNPSVVIDDNILYIGDTLHGVTVIRIHPDYVELAKNEKTWTQKLYQQPPAQWNEDK